MLPWIKIAGLSAILAAGAVTAFGSPGQAAITPSKISYDRLPSSGDVPEVRPEARALVGAPVKSEEVGLSPFLRPLAQTARAVFPQAAFLCDRLR